MSATVTNLPIQTASTFPHRTMPLIPTPSLPNPSLPLSILEFPYSYSSSFPPFRVMFYDLMPPKDVKFCTYSARDKLLCVCNAYDPGGSLYLLQSMITKCSSQTTRNQRSGVRRRGAFTLSVFDLILSLSIYGPPRPQPYYTHPRTRYERC